jgi:hypothetical protein
MKICVGTGAWVGEGTGADEIGLLEGESVEDTVGSKVVAFLVGTDVLGAFVDGAGIGALVGLRVGILVGIDVLGVFVDGVGALVGLRVGILVGIDVLGAGVDGVGALVGLRMGVLVGPGVVGAAVVGPFVGEGLGRRDGFSVGADVVWPAVGAWVSTVAIIFPTVPWQPIQHSVQHSQTNSSQSAIKTDKLHVSKGMVPVIRLLYRVSDVKKGKLTNAVGTWPLNWLDSNASVCRLITANSSTGMDPSIWLSLTLSVLNDSRWLSWNGIVPEMRFLCSFKAPEQSSQNVFEHFATWRNKNVAASYCS